MADSVITFTPINHTMIGNVYRVTGSVTIAPAPGTYTAGGIAMSFLQGTVKATRTPIWVDFVGQNGYEYAYIPGADAGSGKLKILTTANTEVAAGAMPATISSDVIWCRAEFRGEN